MVKGFTDREKKFHPITDYSKVKKSSGKTIEPSGIRLKKDNKIPVYNTKVNWDDKRKPFRMWIVKHPEGGDPIKGSMTIVMAEHYGQAIDDFITVWNKENRMNRKIGYPVVQGTADKSFRYKKKTFTSTSGQLLVLKNIEERPEPKQSTVDVLANLQRPKNLPANIGFKNIRDGVGEFTFFPDGKYPFTRDGEIDVGRVRNAVARGSQQGVIDQLKRRGLCKVMELAGIKVSIICKGLEG